MKHLWIILTLTSACGGTDCDPLNPEQFNPCGQYALCVSLNTGDPAELKACDVWYSACELQED